MVSRQQRVVVASVFPVRVAIMFSDGGCDGRGVVVLFVAVVIAVAASVALVGTSGCQGLVQVVQLDATVGGHVGRSVGRRGSVADTADTSLSFTHHSGIVATGKVGLFVLTSAKLGRRDSAGGSGFFQQR